MPHALEGNTPRRGPDRSPGFFFWNIANGERFNRQVQLLLALARSSDWQEPRSALATMCRGFSVSHSHSPNKKAIKLCTKTQPKQAKIDLLIFI